MRRAGAVALVAVIASLGLAVAVPRTGADAVAPTGHPVLVSKTVQRTFTDSAGRTTVVDRRRVTVTIARTTGLKSLQLTKVSWTGAHPTGGIVADQNSDTALDEEYPMALFECRGTDTASHPLSPETCWTQYADERFVYDGQGQTPYPAWRSDSAATPAERSAFVNRPTGRAFTPDCANSLLGSSDERWVPFVGADKHVYPGGLAGCAGQPAEAAPNNLSGGVTLPSNETYGVTDASGKGSTNFDVFSAEDHASLGCSASVACSLVAVPIMGVSCDPYGTELPPASRPSDDDAAAAASTCQNTGKYNPGQILPAQGHGQPAVSARLWWSPSNWANRIAIPLTFAPADNVCSLQGSAATTDIYGSEILTQATTSWAPYFCLRSSLFDLNHVQTPEPQARNLLQQGNIEAAYTSEPPDTAYPLPTVNAPVAVSGFAVAATVDDKNGQAVSSLRLNARLLAKLLTESYPAVLGIKADDAALANNPLNITYDPEFQALNPNIPETSAQAAATLLTLSSDSDVVHAMTQYIDADPEARAWLNGYADPWGMVVNPNYKRISLPVDNWPLRDTTLLNNVQGINDCLYVNPTPFLPLVAAPTARLFSIAQDMQFALAQSQTTCVLPSPIAGSTDGAKLVANGRQAGGRHFMLGVVSLGDGERDGLTLSSLETQSKADPTDRITSAAGRTFVAPTQASLKAAAATLVPDETTGTWSLPYSTLRTSSADAYPGTMVVYAAIPTKGLPAADAKDYGTFLDFAAGRGQQPGTAQGDLPPGYLPMTRNNHLGALASYTRRAASAVSAQQGTLPSLLAGATRPHSSTSTRSSDDPAGDPGNDGRAVGGAPAPAGTAPSSATTSPNAQKRGPATSSAPGTVAASPVAARTPRFDAATAGLLPVLLGGAIALLVGALVVRTRTGRRTP